MIAFGVSFAALGLLVLMLVPLVLPRLAPTAILLLMSLYCFYQATVIL